MSEKTAASRKTPTRSNGVPSRRVRPSGGARHSPDNAYARGTETRARVIEAAIEVFGRRGFEQASTREIADQAGVRNAAIHYYFGSKGGLYYACMDVVTRKISDRVEGLFAFIDPILRSRPGKKKLIGAYCDLYASLLESFFAKDEGVSVELLFTLGDDVEEVRVARELMRDRVERPLFTRMSGLIGRIMDREPGDLETGLNTIAVGGLTIIFQLERKRIANVMRWKDPTPNDLAKLRPLVRNLIELLLNSLYVQARRKGLAPKD